MASTYYKTVQPFYTAQAEISHCANLFILSYSDVSSAREKTLSPENAVSDAFQTPLLACGLHVFFVNYLLY